MKPNRLTLRHVAQIKEADVEFGDLTVLVGPQATGKSIFLQLLKLVIDKPAIHRELKRFNIEWARGLADFLNVYLGEGMSGIWTPSRSRLEVDGKARDLAEFARSRPSDLPQRCFLIPAQRVMSMRDGVTWPFGQFRSSDPFAIREFSDQLHNLAQQEFRRSTQVFPQSNRLKNEYRKALDASVFGGFSLSFEANQMQKRFVLRRNDEEQPALPFLVWSAGQREFVPLLLGLYWLMPPAAKPKQEMVDWVLIEELEMGLHPDAISTSIALVLELLKRGYRVVLSTHSPHVLDVVWALRIIKESLRGNEYDVLKMLDLKKSGPTIEVAKAALKKDCRVYFFERDGIVKDISRLDPGADETAEAGWGGLTEFSGRVGDIVAEVVNRA